MESEPGRILKISGNSISPVQERSSKGGKRAQSHTLDETLSLKSEILKRTSMSLELKKIPASELNSPQWKIKIENAIRKVADETLFKRKNALPVSKSALIYEILSEITGLGPIEGLINDPSVTEIMINGRNTIFVEREGRLIATELTFSSDDMILAMIDRILAPLGKRIDISSPTVDARLEDGSRVHAIIPPLSLQGPVVTIRKFSPKVLDINDMIRLGTLSSECASYLLQVVRDKKNIVVAGSTASGKTTLLNILAGAINPDERVIVIEDSCELNLSQKHTIYLEARPPNIEGKGEVTIRELVKNSLRMRPDRIIVGECRSGEALDMLQAMNTGHEGSMTTLHSNSPRDALLRLETMVLMSGFDLPLRAIREQIASAIDVIVHLTRCQDGKRRITSISEVCGTEDSIILTQELFKLKRFPGSNKLRIEPTGNIPRRNEDL